MQELLILFFVDLKAERGVFVSRSVAVFVELLTGLLKELAAHVDVQRSYLGLHMHQRT